jgi:hypothetical protein
VTLNTRAAWTRTLKAARITDVGTIIHLRVKNVRTNGTTVIQSTQGYRSAAAAAGALTLDGSKGLTGRINNNIPARTFLCITPCKSPCYIMLNAIICSSGIDNRNIKGRVLILKYLPLY